MSLCREGIIDEKSWWDKLFARAWFMSQKNYDALTHLEDLSLIMIEKRFVQRSFSHSDREKCILTILRTYYGEGIIVGYDFGKSSILR